MKVAMGRQSSSQRREDRVGLAERKGKEREARG